MNTTTIDFTSYNSAKEDGEIVCPNCGSYTGIDIFDLALQTKENDNIGCPLCKPEQYPITLLY